MMTAPAPAGPGLPRAAPSVNSCTRGGLSPAFAPTSTPPPPPPPPHAIGGSVAELPDRVAAVPGVALEGPGEVLVGGDEAEEVGEDGHGSAPESSGRRGPPTRPGLWGEK